MPWIATWLELPAKDAARAAKFYEAVLESPSMAWSDGVRHVYRFNPKVEGGPGLSVNQVANFEPSNKGALIYLQVDGGIESALQRATDNGGKVLEGKTAMGEMGFYAIVEDSEGNYVALYALPETAPH